MPVIILGAPGPVFQDPNQQSVHSNATVTANGSSILTGYGATEVTLFINVKASPTGGSPTLQYTIQEVDPGDGTTVIGATATSTSINAIGIQKITLLSTFGGSIKVSWTVGGSSPSFTQVYATLVAKAGSVALVDESGASISASNPLRTDPTGSTTQPISGSVSVSGTATVSGTVTANQGNQGSHAQRWVIGLSDGAGFISPALDRTTAGGPFSFRLSDGSSFYDGAKTGQFPTSLVGGRLDVNAGAWLGSTAPTVGQKAMASSLPVVIASDQSAVPVSGTVAVSTVGGTVDVSDRAGRLVGVVYGSQGQQLKQTATDFNLQVEVAVGGTLIDPRAIRALTGSDVVTAAQGTGAAAGAPWSTRLSDGSSFYDAAKTGQFPAALVGGRLDTNTGSWFGSTAPTVGQKTMASSIPIVIASDQSTLPTTNASVGSNNAAIPSSSTQMGGSDGTNLQVVRVFDGDTGGGAQYVLGVSLRKSASGGSVEAGTSSDPLRTDPTGTTAQPVTQATAANLNATVVQGAGSGAAGTYWAVRLSDGSSYYTAPAATQLPASLVGGRLDVNTGAWLGSTAPTVGSKTMANSIPVVLASDQTQFPAALVGGRLDINNGAWLGSTAPTVGAKTAANSIPTVGATDQPPFDATGSGSLGALNNAVSIALSGLQGVGMFLAAGTLQGTIAAEISFDGGTTWVGSYFVDPTTGTAAATIVFSSNNTETTRSILIAGGASHARVRVSAYTSGSATCNVRVTQAADPCTLMTGTDGTTQRSLLLDPNGRIITAPAGAGASNGFTNGDVALSSITTSVVRRTTYNEQTTNAQRSISSANANDTSAGTGARQVKITYYDATGAGPSTETVTLNGTTPVNTVSSTICFIEKMEVVSVGSGGQNAGIITLFVSTAGGGGTIGTIAAGDNRTFWCHHYVPTGKTCNITSLSVVVNGGGALFFVRAKTIGVSTAVNLQVTDYVRSATQSGTSTREYGTPIQVAGPATLLMYVTTEANTSLTYRGAFDFYDE